LIGLARQRPIHGDEIARPRRLARDDDLILAEAAVDRDRGPLEARQHQAFVDDLLGGFPEIAVGVLLHLCDDELLVEGAAVHADSDPLIVIDWTTTGAPPPTWT